MNKPSFRSFAMHPDDAMHSAMYSYARSLDKSIYNVEVHYGDGTMFIDSFIRATKEVTYRVFHQDERYSVNVDTGRFNPSYLAKYKSEDDVPQTMKGIRTLFLKWLNDSGIEYTKVIWKSL